MRDDGEEFMDARPRYGPWGLPLRQSGNMGIRGVVPGRILSVGVNEKVAVNGNHPPRPS